MEERRSRHYDYIITGSGIAGLYTALLASRHGSVLVITKGNLEESNTRYAQGGIAAAWSKDDAPQFHTVDTLIAGDGLCDTDAVRVLCDEAPSRIRDLMSFGVEWDKHNGTISLGREGAHGKSRILHAGGDATGARIEHALAEALRQAGVRFLERHFVTEILVENGTAHGVRALTPDGETVDYFGRVIVLASGGAGNLFRYTTNPAIATGDGVALAARAGAVLADVEFYQFHPTALAIPGAPTFLISEAVRGEGAYLRNEAGERFVERYDPRGELASRDIVTRAILTEMRRQGSDKIYLDLRHIPAAHVLERFPTINAFCQKYGIDITRDLIPIAPAAHYMMGGVRTDIWGRTSIPALFACGEVACTGVHGANRLASNSLLEGIVFGGRIVAYTTGQADLEQQTAPYPLPEELSQPVLPQKRLHVVLPARQPETSGHTLEQLQTLMWNQVGMERNATDLEAALQQLNNWLVTMPESQTPAEHELANLTLLGRLMAQAALTRTESRGGHYRADYPTTDPEWRRHISLDVVTAPVARREPVAAEPAR